MPGEQHRRCHHEGVGVVPVDLGEEVLAGREVPVDLTRANRLVTCFEPLENVAGGVGEIGVEGEVLAVDLNGR
jgi:hypothetical protein